MNSEMFSPGGGMTISRCNSREGIASTVNKRICLHDNEIDARPRNHRIWGGGSIEVKESANYPPLWISEKVPRTVVVCAHGKGTGRTHNIRRMHQNPRKVVEYVQANRVEGGEGGLLSCGRTIGTG